MSHTALPLSSSESGENVRTNTYTDNDKGDEFYDEDTLGTAKK